MLELSERVAGKGSPQKLRQLAKIVVAAALNGDMAAVREVSDRVDGKASAFGSDAEIKTSFVVRLPPQLDALEWERLVSGRLPTALTDSDDGHDGE